MIYSPGKQLFAADALSRATEGEDSSSTEEQVELHVNVVVTTMSTQFLNNIQKRDPR